MSVTQTGDNVCLLVYITDTKPH